MDTQQRITQAWQEFVQPVTRAAFEAGWLARDQEAAAEREAVRTAAVSLRRIREQVTCRAVTVVVVAGLSAEIERLERAIGG